MKLLLLTHSFYPAIGGIETIAEILADAFYQEGYQLHVVTWTGDETNKEYPFKVIRNPSIKKLFLEHQWADIVFENNPCVRLAWPKLFFGRPCVISLHTWIARMNGKLAFQDKLKHFWLKRSDKVLACSNALRQHSWPAATVIENPYREDIFQKHIDVPRENTFVFLGRLVSDKGASLAIEAFDLFARETVNNTIEAPQLTLTIIGDGPQRKELENKVHELGLESLVLFKGSLCGEVLVKELNKHAYMLVPSQWEEPFGVVVLEGMACGCIPIVSNGGGLPEAVGKAGLTFERGNVNSLVAVIKQLLKDRVLEDELRKAAPNHLEAHHSTIVAAAYLKVIEEVFGQQNVNVVTS